MKTIINNICFLCFSSLCYSQTYQSFPSDSAMWKEWAYEVDASHMDSWDYQYFIQGDTIISGMTYHKVLKTGTFYQSSAASYGYNYVNQYTGGIREDNSKHIYFYPPLATSEGLLYDFNLNLGDTLGYWMNNDSPDNWVSSVDSVLIGAQYHKRYFISGDTTSSIGRNYVALIEGVGSTFGLLGRLIPVFESESHLVCFSRDGIMQYNDGTTTTCNPVIINVSENKREIDIKIFPNPTRGEFYITSKTNEKRHIKMFNILGEQVYSIETQQEQKLINISQLPKGFYTVQIQQKQEVVLEKIIVE